MIESFRHKGLKKLYDDDDSRGVLSEHLPKLRNILARLDSAASIEDLNLSGFRLHSLKGDLKGYCAVIVRANWRGIFRFADGKATDVDYLDYH